MIPIVGARLASQLEDSLACVNAELPSEAIETLNKFSAVTLGFPHEFLQSEGVHDVLFAGRYADVINHRREYLR
jgi:hypothetical protein